MSDIVESDVKFYKAENQSDTDLGGGRMSPNIVVSGEVNNLFPNISRIDRLVGRIQLKKIFQKIDSLNTAVYSGANVIVRDIPLDDNVSILLFDTDDHNDRRPDIVSYVEAYYEESTPAGNAGLEYPVSIGDTQLVFKIRDYEYTPEYKDDGRLNYIKKVDAKYALNINVKDLIVLDDGNGTVEYAHVQSMQRVTDNLDNADAFHYYTVEYVIVTLADGLLNDFPAGVVPRRTIKNTNWKCFGAMRLKNDANAENSVIEVESTKARLAPVITRGMTVEDQAFFGPPSIVDAIPLSADGINWTVDQGEQINVSESIQAEDGKKTYTHSLINKPREESTLEVWYISEGEWYLLTEDAGTLSGNGIGNVNSEDTVSINLDFQPDSGSQIIFYYTRQHNFSINENLNLNSDVVYQEEQVEIPPDTLNISGTLSASLPIQANFIKLFIDTGNGFVPFGSDSKINETTGSLSGDNIKIGTIDYFSREWSLTLNSSYPSGAVLKWQYVLLEEKAISESYDLGNSFKDSHGGTKVFFLNKHPVSSELPPDFVISSFYEYKQTVYPNSTNDIGYTTYIHTLQEIHCEIQQDGSINLNSNYDNDGTCSGTFDPITGKLVISFNFNHVILDSVSLDINYHYYNAVAQEQTSLPYTFSVGKENIIPNSLLLQYYIQGVSLPWYALDKNGVLELVYSMKDWELGNAFNVNIFDFDAVYGNGQWTATMGGGYQGIWTSGNGKDWIHVYQTPSDATSSAYQNNSSWNAIAVKESSNPVWIACGYRKNSGSESYPNAGRSLNGSDWTTMVIDNYTRLMDVEYCPELDIFIIIESGKIFTSNDDGDTWVEQTSQISSDMQKIISFSPTGSTSPVIICFGIGNTMQYSTDGVNFSIGASKLSGKAVGSAVLPVNDVDTLFIADDAGNLSKSTDGINFELLQTSVSGTPTSIASDGIDTLIIAFNAYHYMISKDYGETWETVNSGDSNLFWDIQHSKIFFSLELGWLNLIHAKSIAGNYDKIFPYVSPLQNIMTDGNGNPIKKIGTFDPETGNGVITDGEIPQSLQARYCLTPRRVSDFVVTTKGAVPIYPNTFTASAETYSGAKLLLYEDTTNEGQLTGKGLGTFDRETGIATLSFSFPVRPESVKLSYSYGSIYHPQYDEINTRAMPLDGLVPVCRKDDIAVIVEFARSPLVADISDTDTSFDIQDGSIFPDREIVILIEDEQILGIISGNTFTVSSGGRGYNGTTSSAHTAGTLVELYSRNEEMITVLGVSETRITSMNSLTHSYKAGGAIISTAILKGDLQALETDHFDQASWDGTTWVDSDNAGSPADGTYDWVNYPLQLTNKGATTERWAIKIVSLSPMKVDIIGEYLGTIATDQDASYDLSPINPNTNQPYFTLSAQGWGGGWQVGNILRFNTKMAGAPLWVCRVINARASNTIDDHAVLQSRGDVAV